MDGRGRTLVVGDVHGCLDELDELLRTSGYRRGEERLVFLGDLLDRGPDPVGVLRRARELEAEVVLGNHEEKHLRYAAHEARRKADRAYRNPMRPLSEAAQKAHAALTEEDLAYLRGTAVSLPLDGSWATVHAGLACKKIREIIR